ncbi:hypothetical protein BS50DRAFT_357148 [Corynespora cassiicola Philippines]|uniref:Uncharacterized protein n=1 Tax=Corynespora cassiicola Philippines TaxID=1448308 RepID=A0A2T2NRW1_CORCC|nr:hypothetical protein BS50DRAFT_357148 [Corynespora cassiicola Philippines]
MTASANLPCQMPLQINTRAEARLRVASTVFQMTFRVCCYLFAILRDAVPRGFDGDPSQSRPVGMQGSGFSLLGINHHDHRSLLHGGRSLCRFLGRSGRATHSIQMLKSGIFEDFDALQLRPDRPYSDELSVPFQDFPQACLMRRPRFPFEDQLQCERMPKFRAPRSRAPWKYNSQGAGCSALGCVSYERRTCLCCT